MSLMSNSEGISQVLPSESKLLLVGLIDRDREKGIWPDQQLQTRGYVSVLKPCKNIYPVAAVGVTT